MCWTNINYLFFWVGKYMYSETHLDSSLINVSRHHCPNKCGRHYKGRDGLKRHLKIECGMDPKFSCSFCKKSFFYLRLYKCHMASIHKIIFNSYNSWGWCIWFIVYINISSVCIFFFFFVRSGVKLNYNYILFTYNKFLSDL